MSQDYHESVFNWQLTSQLEDRRPSSPAKTCEQLCRITTLSLHGQTWRIAEMFDINLRPLKDALFDPCCKYVPAYVSPHHITLLAFFAGLLSLYSAASTPHISVLALSFWILNRLLDCLDGALARYRGTASDLGGFLDLLGDFIIYSALPIAIAHGYSSEQTSAEVGQTWRAVAVLEATFHVNNFILFYLAATAEKQSNSGQAVGVRKSKSKEVTSVMMKPALIEGMESGTIFTAMLAFPSQLGSLSWIMATLVTVGIMQRTTWAIRALA